MGMGKVLGAIESSEQRVERVIQTYILKKHGYSAESIASYLGVSSNTVRDYIREINDDRSHYESIYQKRLAKAKKIEEERIRKLSRSHIQIVGEESLRSLWRGLKFCLITLLWWWLFAFVLVVVGFMIRGNEIEIFHWIYSIKGFIISTLVVSSIIASYKILTAWKESQDYRRQKKKKEQDYKTEYSKGLTKALRLKKRRKKK